MGFLDFLARLLNSSANPDTRRWFGAPTPGDMILQDMPDNASYMPPDAVMTATPRPMSEIAQDQVAQLQKIDPDFNQVAFLNQASAAFAPAFGLRGASDIQINAPTLMKVTVDGTRQLLLVRFTGTATRDGGSQPQTFTEFATFTRPAGSTTPKSVVAGAPATCPGCGAPTPPGALVCPYCQTQLTGTGGDWTLDHLSESAYR